MTATSQTLPHHGEYGLDGNFAGTVGMTAVTAALFSLSLLLSQAGRGTAAMVALAVAALLALTLGIALHTTRRGKFVVWSELIAGLNLRGDERVLDVGCGRGAVLTTAARALPRGHIVGLDLWNKADQSGNGLDAARRNVEAEGVRDCCELVTGDMRTMPFPDSSFDVVISSIAIHNILSGAGRMQAIDEIARVLKPGGRLVIADLAWTRAYAERFRERGIVNVSRRSLGWRFWWGPGYPSTAVVTGTKNSAA